MNKLAVVFHGIVGGIDGRNGLGAPIDLEVCAKTIKQNILSRYDHDIFVHSWSIEHKDAIMSTYNPIQALFEKQDMLGFNFDENAFKNEDNTHAFRTVSRYTSIERAMELKTLYEEANNFKYDWVIILRFDLVFFKPLFLENLDNNNFYICYEPHWPYALDVNNKLRTLHDIIFLSSSELMDNYCKIADEIRKTVYSHTLHAAHVIAWEKLRSMFNGFSKVKYGFKRYEDIEIYRFIMKPELNPIGHAYGALELKNRLENYLKEL